MSLYQFWPESEGILSAAGGIDALRPTSTSDTRVPSMADESGQRRNQVVICILVGYENRRARLSHEPTRDILRLIPRCFQSVSRTNTIGHTSTATPSRPARAISSSVEGPIHFCGVARDWKQTTLSSSGMARYASPPLPCAPPATGRGPYA